MPTKRIKLSGHMVTYDLNTDGEIGVDEVSDTPRTDAEECEASIGIRNYLDDSDVSRGYAFARQLERELTAAQAENERLTRELSESKATIKRLEAEKAFLSESHLAQENKRLVAEMLELRNAIQRDTDAFLRLSWERDQLLARVKRLEEAGGALADSFPRTHPQHDELMNQWTKAKEAKP